MRRECRTGADCRGNLRGRRPSVADARHHALGDDGFDELWSVRPFGRKRHQANVASGGILETLELGKIGRPDPGCGMRSARTIVRRDIRTLQMERLHYRTVRDGFLRSSEIAQRGRHVLRRSGDHGRKHSCNAASEHRTKGLRDLFVAGVG